MVICSVADDEEQARAEAAAQIAFYAAPRTYSNCVEVAGFGAAGDDPAAFAARDDAAWPGPYPMNGLRDGGAGGAAQVAGQLAAFGRYADHVIVYPAKFGLTGDRSQQVADEVRGRGARLTTVAGQARLR